jgi:repressor LexA
MIGISNKQGEMLAFIETFVTKHGYPPTREEIKTGLNISTKSLVNYHLEALESAALLTRIPNTPRGLKLNCGNGRTLPKRSNQVIDGDATVLDHKDVLELTFGMVTNNRNLYAQKAENDTIVDTQTDKGDVVILQRQTFAKNGEMVAIKLVEQDTTKLKRYFRENGHVRLEPVNTATEALIVKPNTVEIQGKVVAVIKQVDQAG